MIRWRTLGVAAVLGAVLLAELGCGSGTEASGPEIRAGARRRAAQRPARSFRAVGREYSSVEEVEPPDATEAAGLGPDEVVAWPLEEEAAPLETAEPVTEEIEEAAPEEAEAAEFEEAPEAEVEEEPMEVEEVVEEPAWAAPAEEEPEPPADDWGWE
jgi:hypothetical protein